jgi:hypothetical protein
MRERITHDEASGGAMWRESTAADDEYSLDYHLFDQLSQVELSPHFTLQTPIRDLPSYRQLFMHEYDLELE